MGPSWAIYASSIFLQNLPNFTNWINADSVKLIKSIRFFEFSTCETGSIFLQDLSVPVAHIISARSGKFAVVLIIRMSVGSATICNTPFLKVLSTIVTSVSNAALVHGFRISVLEVIANLAGSVNVEVLSPLIAFIRDAFIQIIWINVSVVIARDASSFSIFLLTINAIYPDTSCVVFVRESFIRASFTSIFLTIRTNESKLSC
jgi:hypothetical protein